MSNKENTVLSAVDPDSFVFSQTKSNQHGDPKNVFSTNEENCTISVAKNQNINGEHTESTAVCNRNDQTTEAVKRGIGIAGDNLQAAAEVVLDSAGETTSKIGIPEGPNVQQSIQPSALEVRQQTIGAGDTCFFTKHDENGNAQRSEINEPVNDQTSASEHTSLEMDKTIKDEEDEYAISRMKEEVQKASDERDSYQKKLENVEKKLALLQASYDALLKGDGDEMMLRRMVDQLNSKLIQTSLQLEDRIRVVSNQEKQISALNSQVASLKEVESLTRSLLQIRNMEVKHLQAEVDDMEVRINEERERYNTMINKMDAAVKLNADLKKEYETQLCLFRDLREKYEEKVTLLSEEKRALENNAQSDQNNVAP